MRAPSKGIPEVLATHNHLPSRSMCLICTKTTKFIPGRDAFSTVVEETGENLRRTMKALGPR